MKLSAIRQIRKRWALVALVIAAQLLTIYAISWLPLSFQESDGNLPVYEYRLLNMALSLLLIWVFVPEAFKFFRLRLGGYPPIFTFALFGALVIGSLLYGWFQKFPILVSLDAIVFSLFIGLDEEFFGRVFAFGILQRAGTEFAMAVSAVVFGLAHLTNYYYGNESVSYVVGHVIEAAGYGYLMATLLIITGNVWVPVMIHGLSDLKWVTMDMGDYNAIVTGQTNWFATIVVTATFISFSRLMLAIHQERLRFPQSWQGALRWLGLVE